ncbi:MAG TPA: glycosyltransferase family 4 protein [Ilumatobacteraceae bacterium]|nr:glycosyltransferase family 4 protein [Ilumatobacteraceae bacterium]
MTCDVHADAAATNPVVLLITETSDIYGAEQWAHALAGGLASQGFCVHFARPHPQNAPPLDPRVRLLSFDTFDLDDPYGWVTDRSLTAALLDQVQPDLVVVSCATALANVGAREELVARGVPFISVHHLGGEDGFDLPCPKALSAAVAQVHANASAVVGVSMDVVESLRHDYWLDDDRGGVIANGRPDVYFEDVDPENRLRVRHSLGLADDDVMVFTAARIHPAKGYQYQLDAIEQLRGGPAWDRLRFVWAGGTDALRRLRAVVLSRKLMGTVQLLGPRSDIIDLLDAADIFVLPSKQEGTPLAVIEAMAKGLPVITTPVNGIPALVGDTAWLLPDPNTNPHGTVTALADAVEHLAADRELRAQLGARARERAVTGWREQGMVDAYGSLIREVLARRDAR